ncbi:MAG TPA: TadE family protein [Bryobacteraceae bacterium]|nr:TadE family protein [Bryobacteraceae bacterium]
MIRRNRRKGSTLLESVLTLVVFLSLFIGVLDMGEMFFVHQTLTDRARNAARWGAVNAFDPVSMQNLVLYGAKSPVNGQTPSFGLTTANVTVTRPAASIGLPEDRVVVTVVYPVTLVSVFIGQSAHGWSNAPVPTWNLRIQISVPYEVPS